MDFLGNLERMIERNKIKKQEFDKHIEELKSVQSENFQNQSVRLAETAELDRLK